MPSPAASLLLYYYSKLSDVRVMIKNFYRYKLPKIVFNLLKIRLGDSSVASVL